MGQQIKLKTDFKLRQKRENKKLSLITFRAIRENSLILNYRTYRLFLKRLYSFGTTRARNFCVLTGNGKNVVQRYRIVRHEFKRLVNSGLLTGLRKSTF